MLSRLFNLPWPPEFFFPECPCCDDGIGTPYVATEDMGSGVIVFIADSSIHGYCDPGSPYTNIGFWENIEDLMGVNRGAPDDKTDWSNLRAGAPTISDINVSGDFASITGLFHGITNFSFVCEPGSTFRNFHLLDSSLYTALKNWITDDGGVLVLIDEYILPPSNCYPTVTANHNTLLSSIGATARFGAAVLDSGCGGEGAEGNGWSGFVNSSHPLIDGTHGNVLTGLWHAATNDILNVGDSSKVAVIWSGTSAVVTGTAVLTIDEADVVSGGKTIIITLTGDTWVASGTTFDAQRQNIIDGLDSAQSEGTGWNAEVRDKEVVGAVVRTSPSVVTITLTAQAAYDVTAQETITVTIPALALVAIGVAVVATPTFTVDTV